ncbi:MAG TPA: S41 family peptidase [Bryobacteraceae bacterium]|nr:S41 family peptidase [Bryobacteraceae bacterium]
MSRIRNYLFAPVVIIVCSIGAGFINSDNAVAATQDDDVAQSMRSFTKILDTVQRNFADQVNDDKAIYNGAIPGMLHTLDPHSNFFDPKAYAEMRDEQRAHYYGLGMTVGPGGDKFEKTVVRYPMNGSPADKAGLRAGDAILVVNDKKTDGMDTTQVVNMIKGPRGTYVQLKIGRDGHDQPLTFNVMRDEISQPSVAEAFMVRPGIAYVWVKNFTDEHTSKELEDDLKALGEANLKGLILDLRENPGGILNEGIEVAGHFLKKGQIVVSHSGRTQPSKSFTSRTNNGGHDYPMVVLVNRRSASAAEIVSGALQDHDRAWILGETTFGKGLVQSVFPLSENTALALTTMQYYTPSGRWIQRKYSDISFLDYYFNNKDQRNTNDVKMTDSGRTVYGGGGITPDEKYDPPKMNRFQIDMIRNFEFFNFAAEYFGPKSDPALPKGWEPDENMVNSFHDFLMKKNVKFTEADFTENHQWVKEQLKQEMYITGFSFDASERVRIEQDPEVAKAVEAMPKAQGLLDRAKKMMVERMPVERAAQ